MKFKRIISTVLATVMAASVMSVGMISSASATPQSYVFADMKSTLSAFDFNAGGTIVEGLEYISGDTATAEWQEDATKGTGVKLTGKSTSSKRLFTVNADEGETITVTFVGHTTDATPDCVITNDKSKMTASGTPEAGVYAREEGSGYTPTTVSLIAGASGGTYYIGSPGTKSVITAITVSTVTHASGKVTFTSSENGTVTVKNGDVAITSGDEIPGGTQLILTAEPNEGYKASLTVNENPEKLQNNTYSFVVDGAITLHVEFVKNVPITPITATVAYDARNGSKATDSLVYDSSNDDVQPEIYYFNLSSGATRDAGKRINISSSTDGSSGSILFATGDLTGKTANLIVSYASSNDTDPRTVNLYKKESGEAKLVKALGTTASTGATQYKISEPVTLDTNTEYFICTANKNMYIDMILISVTGEGVEPTILKATEQNTNKTYDSYAPASTGTDTYIIHPVTTTELESGGDKLVITGTTIETSEVYKSVKLGDKTVTATEVGGDYLFAIVVTGTNGTGPAHKLDWDIPAPAAE